MYSSFKDGRSALCLEHAVLGYSGPTVLLVKTTREHVLGAFASVGWKDVKGEFYGNPDCFLFELEPDLRIYRSKNDGGERNFMYLHLNKSDNNACHSHPHGLGMGGTLEHPRFFITESLEKCSAESLDKTFREGELLPPDALEKFEIQTLEVWGVGGDAVIQKALEDRAEYRQRVDELILRARMVHDKSQFVSDLQSGLVPNRLYGHQTQVRGRQDFVVDDDHGGYKIDQH